MTTTATSVLQVGFGDLGPTHLEAWRRLRADVWIADPDPGARARAATYLPTERLVADFRAALDHVPVVDVVTPTAQHVDLCIAAIEAGKDVFVERREGSRTRWPKAIGSSRSATIFATIRSPGTPRTGSRGAISAGSAISAAIFTGSSGRGPTSA
jgi:hypothetical protein